MAQIARQHLFAHRNMENIPPSEAAPLQNVLRAVNQAGYLWGLGSRIKSPVFPSANDEDWQLGLVMDPPLIPMCLFGPFYRKRAKFAKSIHIANAKKAVGSIACASIILYAAQRYEWQ